MENSLVVLHLERSGYQFNIKTTNRDLKSIDGNKNRSSEDVYRQKSYFHFRFNTNSGGFFPMQSIFLFETTRTSNMGLTLS
jgi:hypothetical protein